MQAVITTLPGDGIGPDVVAEGVRVLQAVAERFGHQFETRSALLGGAAIDATGTALPEETLRLCRESDAVLLGAVGGPKWDNPDAKVRPEQGLLGIRKALGLFANLRPVTLARGRRGKLTSVDKANVLETSRLWRSVTARVMRDEFPDVQLEHLLVDACAMHLIRRPADFDVIVPENMFGDILTDEASMLAGSMGMLPSASLGESVVRSPSSVAVASGPRTTDHEQRTMRMGLYEPIHGSAPDIAGKGIANPLATILSVALLLRLSLGLEAEARAVEAAVAAAVDAGYITGDIAAPGEKTYSTSEVGAAVAERVTVS